MLIQYFDMQWSNCRLVSGYNNATKFIMNTKIAFLGLLFYNYSTFCLSEIVDFLAGEIL